MVNPTPWTADDTRVTDADGQLVCVCGVFTDKAVTPLLAAAPDLLVALRELLAAGQFCVDSTDDVASMLRFGRAHDAADAAIAKAEAR